jgi:hypothetical protein
MGQHTIDRRRDSDLPGFDHRVAGARCAGPQQQQAGRYPRLVRLRCICATAGL